MSYRKPSVTVRQVQVTESLPLPDPSLVSCVVGPAYYWQDPFREDDEMNSVYSDPYVGAELEVPISYFTEYTNVVTGTLFVELVRTKGPGGDIGSITPLISGTDYTFAEGAITIAAELDGYDTEDDAAKVRVGFLSLRDDMVDSYQKITEAQEIVDYIGLPVPWNPLAFGASLALSNSGRSTTVVGTNPATGPANALSLLESKEVYALAALTSTAVEAEAFGTHVTQMSLPENKKERIAFASRKVTSYNDSEYYENDASNSEKSETAQDIQNYAAGIGNRRYFQVHPDAGWVEANVPVATLRQDFIDAVFDFDLRPKFITNSTVGTKKYKAFQDITDSIVGELVAEGISRIRVYYPVPGYYFTAALAGRVAGKQPEEPMTNSSISGFALLHRSNDYFSPSQLDTIAQGGNWILEEKGPGTIVNRHQLSTDAVTIETRELSITTQIDYASKFLRDLVSPLIGRRVISDSFIREITATLKGAAEELVELGRVRDLQVTKVYQDDLEPDTLKVDILLLPLYPLNYIKITLEF